MLREGLDEACEDGTVDDAGERGESVGERKAAQRGKRSPGNPPVHSMDAEDGHAVFSGECKEL